MLLTLAVFSYVGFVSILFGFSLSYFLSHQLKIHQPGPQSSIILAVQGLALLTLVGALLSFGMPLGLWANLIIALIGLFLLLYAGRDFFSFLTGKIRSIPAFHPLTLLLFGAVFLIVLAKSTQEPLNYDTALYHAQNIRWTETYPIVPGLGNLHDRLAFDSNWLLFSALFSFSFLGTPSFHSLGALLVILTAAFSLGKIDRLLKGEGILSSATAIFVVFFLRRIFSLELSSPGTDMPAALLVWLVFLLGMEKAEERTAARFDTRTLSILFLSAFAITIKVSVLPILLIPAYFLIREIRTLKWTGFLASAGTVILILVPWLARNVIISGYLVYPLAGTDWFNVDWKIPADQAGQAAAYIASWARIPNLSPDEVLNLPFTTWVPLWFQKLEVLDRQILFALGAGTVALLVFLVVVILRARKLPETLSRFAVFYSTALLGIAFWFFQAPAVRFGYGFLGILLCLQAAPIFNWAASLFKPHQRKWLPILALSGLLLYQLVGFYNLKEISDLQSHWIFPATYPELATKPVQLANFTLYVPAERDQCSYDPFPCNPTLPTGVVPRGQRLEDGFIHP